MRANSALNGTSESLTTVYVTQNGTALSMHSFLAGGGSCAYTGTLSEAGQMGASQGSFSCTDGSAGMFSLYETQVTIYGSPPALPSTTQIRRDAK